MIGEGLEDIGYVGNHAGEDASNVRNSFRAYYNSDAGSVPWQNNVVRRGLLTE